MYLDRNLLHELSDLLLRYLSVQTSRQLNQREHPLSTLPRHSLLRTDHQQVLNQAITSLSSVYSFLFVAGISSCGSMKRYYLKRFPASLWI